MSRLETNIGPATKHPFFTIERLYIRDMSLEVPGGAEVFLRQEIPEISVQFKTAFSQLSDETFEGILQATVTAQTNNKVYFLIEVQQAGIFRVIGIPKEALNQFLGVSIPNILFPYAREIVSDTSTRAGFPPVILQPVNFDILKNAEDLEAESLIKEKQLSANTVQ